MATWSGSVTADSILTDNPSPVLTMINVALDAINAADVTAGKADIALMGNLIKERQGRPGTYDVFEEFTALFQDDGEFVDPEEFKETYNKWSFQRKGYAIKNGSYDKKTFKDAEEGKQDLDAVIEARTMKILNIVNNIYKPNIIFETLLTAPTTGGGFYEKFGFARGTVVKANKLISVDTTASAGALGSLTRTNYRTIAANTGLSLADINFYKQYFGEIQGINEEDLVVFGNSESLQDIMNLFSDFSPTKEEIITNGMPTGIQAVSVAGLQLVVTKMLPKKTLLIVNPNAPALITKLVSELAKYRGVSIELGQDDEKFLSTAKQMLGAKIVINEEGLRKAC